MKRLIICCVVLVVTAFVVGAPVAGAGQISDRAIELRSENGVGQHGGAQPLQLITEHSAGQHVAQAPDLAAATLVTPPTDTSPFSWRDAGVGAVGAVVVLLVLSSAFFGLYKRGRPAATHG